MNNDTLNFIILTFDLVLNISTIESQLKRLKANMKNLNSNETIYLLKNSLEILSEIELSVEDMLAIIKSSKNFHRKAKEL